jgi:hypothetical protein
MKKAKENEYFIPNTNVSLILVDFEIIKENEFFPAL